jgi:hypothetical protein
MPYWIEGWLEVRRAGMEDESAWTGILRLGPLVDVADDVSERLFGLSKRLTSAGAPATTIAANRGVPPDPSDELRGELARDVPYQRSGELGGYTHATWNELAYHGLNDSTVAESDWQVVFEFAHRLARDDRFGPECVRFVVWYNW